MRRVIMNEREKIRNFIMENVSINKESFTLSDGDNYFEKRIVNSLFAMKLVTFIEEKFQVTIENEDLNLENFSTINRLMDLIDKLKKRGNNHEVK